MAEQYQNIGPVTKTETARDVISTSYIAHEHIIINQGGTTNNFNTNNIVQQAVEPREISFKNVPEPHGAFIGRVEYIKSAVKYLSRPVIAKVQIQFPCLAIHALGGYGKTQTARKIVSVCRKKRKFQHFIWIDSEDSLSVKKCFVAVMIQVGLNASVATDDLNFDLLMHQFYNLLAARNLEKFLIIFDNVEDFDNILKFLPLNRRASNFAVLMTSQRSFTRESYGYIRNQPLKLMLEEEAIQLVENILGASTMDSEEDKKLFVERSGRIALVLCVMTSTVKFQRKYTRAYSLKDYLNKLCDEPIQYSDKSNLLDLNYDKCLQKIVRIAVDKLNVGAPIERIAVNILDRMAYCPSDNWLHDTFVGTFFRDICEEAKNVDMQLPIKPVDDKQVIRMATEKLSEFSLSQIEDDKLTVHRWIQASRRLDLKESGDGRAILKKLLFIVPNMSSGREQFSIVWQHAVADYVNLVNEFYVETKELMKFPIFSVDVLEKVIRVLTQNTDFKPFENYADEIEKVICYQIGRDSLDVVKRTVNLFNYETGQKSTKLLLTAISHSNLGVIKWLVKEKSLILNEDHLYQHCLCMPTIRLTMNLKELKKLSIEITEKRSTGTECEFDKSELLRRSPFAERIASATENIELFALVDSDPLKIHWCNVIEKHCGKDLLDHMLHHASKLVDSHWNIFRPGIFDIFRFIWSALTILDPSKTDEVREVYLENNLLECLIFCGLSHFPDKNFTFETSSEGMKYYKWNDLHRAAFENNITAINSMDATCLDTKDINGCTPLMIAVKAGACEATTLLLEKYSANNCDVCTVDHLGNNILHLLVRYYYGTMYKLNHRVLQLILSANATLINMRNSDGLTPVQLARSWQEKFSHNHWHRANLQSFVSMIRPIAMDGLDVEFNTSPSVAKIPRYS